MQEAAYVGTPLSDHLTFGFGIALSPLPLVSVLAPQPVQLSQLFLHLDVKRLNGVQYDGVQSLAGVGKKHLHGGHDVCAQPADLSLHPRSLLLFGHLLRAEVVEDVADTESEHEPQRRNEG